MDEVMPFSSSSTRVALVVVLVACGCDSNGARRVPPTPAPVAVTKAAAKPSAAPQPSTAPQPSAAPELDEAEAEPARAARHEPPKPLRPSEQDDKPVENSRYVLDALNDVGPAGPAAAFAQGVVMVSRADELVISKLLAPPSKSKKPAAGAFAEMGRRRQDFFAVARGPAVSPSHAYWVSKGRLVRRALAGGELEVLTSDAREGTRVAVVGPPDVVAYITEPVGKQDSLARLRLPDGRKLDLTPEGAAASSVSLARVGEDVVASYIDGRSGMTPVHARRLRAKSGTLDPDVVVWVSGATQGMTEIASIGGDDVDWLLLPVERDASHFGLATLAVSREPKMDPPLRWRTYENGLDRSPVAGAVLCGEPAAVYVRPEDASPGSNQELVISTLSLADTAASERLATARGFADVSLYPLAEGAIVAYVADRRTWARLIRCK
jgi:hypothetical protein